MEQPRPSTGFPAGHAARRKKRDMKAYLEQIFCFCLLFEHRLEHIVHLLGRGILAVARPNAGDQDELLHPRLGCLPYKVHITLQRAQLISQASHLGTDLVAFGPGSNTCCHNGHFECAQRKNAEPNMDDAHNTLSRSSRYMTQAWLSRASTGQALFNSSCPIVMMKGMDPNSCLWRSWKLQLLAACLL